MQRTEGASAEVLGNAMHDGRNGSPNDHSCDFLSLDRCRHTAGVMGTSTPKPVLVVDDHDDSRQLVAAILQKEGYEVVQAANGRQALDFLVSDGKTEPCLILLDLAMPVMSGWEFLTIVKSYHRLASIPVVVTSGVQNESEALRHGAIADYLPKPVEPSVLLGKIRQTMARIGARKSP